MNATLVQHRRHAPRLAIIEAHYFRRILSLQLAISEDVHQNTRRVRQESADALLLSRSVQDAFGQRGRLHGLRHELMQLSRKKTVKLANAS
jgi:hypothetical protein